MWEAELRRIKFPGQFRQKHVQDHILTTTTATKTGMVTCACDHTDGEKHKIRWQKSRQSWSKRKNLSPK
jgi:hypothetical protein